MKETKRDKEDRLAEQETIISFDQLEKAVYIFTACSAVNRKMLAEEPKLKPTRVTKATNGKEDSWTYKLPKSSKAKRVISAVVDF